MFLGQLRQLGQLGQLGRLRATRALTFPFSFSFYVVGQLFFINFANSENIYENETVSDFYMVAM